jgi:ribosome biogenesis GTPase
MSPKFRGGSDDWLDDEQSSRRDGSRPKKKSSKAAFLDPSQANATIVEVFPKQARIRMDDGPESAGRELLCAYRRAQVIQTEQDVRERSPVAVGDRVLASVLTPQDGVIEGVCARRNYLARPAPGKEEQTTLHVIAANIDLLTIVASVRLPDFSPGLVDRYLIAAQAAGISSLICVTKADLMPETGRTGFWDEYRKIGYSVVLSSARQKSGISELLTSIAHKTVVFCGHSGVGKTSLFRTILQSDVGRVGEVNDLTGKGRHTTTSAILYKHGDSQWIDTPGIREFGLVGVTSENLATYFPEFRNLDCAARGCSHLGETDCQAVSLYRYPSFQRIHASLLEQES